MKKKIGNREIILAMVIVAVVLAVILSVVNIVSGKVNDKGEELTSSESIYNELADNITYMIQSADLEVKYVGSDKRIVLCLIGSDGFYGIQYSNNMLYLLEGEYTTATTDEAKIQEATETINSNKGFNKYEDGIMSFNVSGNDSDGHFSGGKISITIGVDSDGKLARNTFEVSLDNA